MGVGKKVEKGASWAALMAIQRITIVRVSENTPEFPIAMSSARHDTPPMRHSVIVPITRRLTAGRPCLRGSLGEARLQAGPNFHWRQQLAVGT